MKTMRKLVKRFNKLWNAEAVLDELESYPGYYRVYVTVDGYTSLYTFTSCQEFKDWAYNVDDLY